MCTSFPGLSVQVMVHDFASFWCCLYVSSIFDRVNILKLYVVEVLGYIARIASINNDTSIGIYATSLLLILVAPILFAASIYMAFGRLIRELRAEAFSPVRSTWMTKIFVAGDILSFLAQAGGKHMRRYMGRQNELTVPYRCFYTL